MIFQEEKCNKCYRENSYYDIAKNSDERTDKILYHINIKHSGDLFYNVILYSEVLWYILINCSDQTLNFIYRSWDNLNNFFTVDGWKIIYLPGYERDENNKKQNNDRPDYCKR